MGTIKKRYKVKKVNITKLANYIIVKKEKKDK